MSHPNVEFRAEPTETPAPDPTEPPKGSKAPDPLRNFVWAYYGYSQDRRHFLNASQNLRPPFGRVWTLGGKTLLEFPPVMAEGKLFLLKNNGAVYAIDKKTGKVVWKQKVGVLAAASPAYGNGRIFVTLLSRGHTKAGLVAALDAKTGKILWRRLLPSRTESSPVFDNDRIYFGSENGTVYALLAADGSVRWTFKASGAVKCALALADGKLYFGDYSGRVYAIHQADGTRSWSTGHQGLDASACARGSSTRRPRWPTGASSSATRTARCTRSRPTTASSPGRTRPAATSTPRPRWRTSARGPTVFFGSYDGKFYAVDAQSGKTKWVHKDGGKISGGSTVVGDIVYFSNIRKRDTTGLGARTGREVFHMGRGSFNPVISDGRTIFLTGYSSLYALRPPAG